LDFAGVTNGGRPYGSLISNGTFLSGITAYVDTNHLEVVFKYALQVVGIDQFSMDNNKLSIYPKPASDNFTISINVEIRYAQVEIYNVFGQKVFNAVLHSHQNFINCKQFSSVIYYVKGRNIEKTFAKKLIVE